MQSIIYVGMDVHTENFTFASYEYGKEDVFAVNQEIRASWISKNGGYRISKPTWLP